ncbi:MAG: rhamnulokinase [Anaerolineae bacterium]|nr:rhamnulokinase [Anaerolineae bacterium]
MSTKRVIAIDLGAESGRVMQVSFDGNSLHSDEIHRFANQPVTVSGTLYWDALRLFHEITTGIRAVPAGAASLGIDTWGVDFAFLDRDGRLLANPLHYRDRSWEGMMDWVFERVPRRELYQRTGLQIIAVNGIWRLAGLVRNHSPLLEIAHTYLTLPDLFNYWLSGSKTCEFTHASTHQLYNPRLNNWDMELIQRLGVPTAVFGEIVPPGTTLGEYQGIRVIAPPTHDTGSAVVAVPTVTDDYAYCSSGTWSLLGLELPEAVIDDAAYEANITNEGGAENTWRFLKNIAGMWLVQQCRATWAAQGTTYEYPQLAAMAEEAPPFTAFIDPDEGDFYQPGDMPAHIRAFCDRTGQTAPETVGAFVRIIYESLAMKYRYVLDQVCRVAGRKAEVFHIIGGGSRNALLCQMTADATGRVVVAGPAEATALGNAIVQLVALGEFKDIAEARRLLSETAGTVTYEPRHTDAWEEAYARFLKVLTVK